MGNLVLNFSDSVGCGYQLSDFEKALLVEAEAEAAAEGMYDEGDDDEAGGDGGEA